MRRAAKAALQTMWQPCAGARSGQRGTPQAEAADLPSPANGLRLRNWNHAYDDDAAVAGDAEHSQQHDRLWRDSNPMFDDVCPLLLLPRPGMLTHLESCTAPPKCERVLGQVEGTEEWVTPRKAGSNKC